MVIMVLNVLKAILKGDIYGNAMRMISPLNAPAVKSYSSRQIWSSGLLYLAPICLWLKINIRNTNLY